MQDTKTYTLYRLQATSISCRHQSHFHSRYSSKAKKHCVSLSCHPAEYAYRIAQPAHLY